MTTFEWITGIWTIISFIIIGVKSTGGCYRKGIIIDKSFIVHTDDAYTSYYFQVLITDDQDNQEVEKIRVSDTVFSSYEKGEKFSVVD
jgi:hypothetical protein